MKLFTGRAFQMMD